MSKKYTIHAGHNPNGKIACGASDYIDESTEARYLVSKIMSINKGHTISNCTVNNGTSQTDVLRKIVAKCNGIKGGFDVSIHFNACSHSTSDKKVKGAEVWLYDGVSQCLPQAKQVLKNLEKLGFKNRGCKFSKTLYFLKNTKKPAMLIEVCFVDDQDDARLYKSKKDLVAKAIYDGLSL